MTLDEVLSLIKMERALQDAKWGAEFDSLNTPNDWVAYITLHTGKAVTLPWDRTAFRNAMLKVAALAVAALERADYAPRHYDEDGRL